MRNFKRNKHKKTFFIVMWQRMIEEYCCFTHFLLRRLINFNANLYCRRKIQNSSSANIIYLINKFNKSTHDKRKEFFTVWIAFVYSNVHRAPKLKDKKHKLIEWFGKSAFYSILIASITFNISGIITNYSHVIPFCRDTNKEIILSQFTMKHDILTRI